VTTDLPPYTATHPDFELTNGRPEMPDWFYAYLIQRQRALKTEQHEIKRLLALFDRDNGCRIEVER
jgi:hypothetical protein